MFIDDIKDILKKQTEMCKCLIDISVKIRIAAEKNDIKQIDQLIRIEDALTMEFFAIEKHRNIIVEAYKKEIGYSSESFCISEMNKFFKKEDADVLKKIGNELKSTISELSRVNETNKKILKSRLDWVDFSLTVLSDDEDNTYSTDDKIIKKEEGLINELV